MAGPGQTMTVSRATKTNQTYRFGRFSAWPLGLSVFILINAAAFFQQGQVRLALVVAALIPFLVWLRLRIRLTPSHLEIRNLFRTTSFPLDNPQTSLWVTDGALWASTVGIPPVRAWGADGNRESRNESAAEKQDELCSVLLRRTFQRGGASLEFD